jgi:hypothetical protein
MIEREGQGTGLRERERDDREGRARDRIEKMRRWEKRQEKGGGGGGLKRGKGMVCLLVGNVSCLDA